MRLILLGFTAENSQKQKLCHLSESRNPLFSKIQFKNRDLLELYYTSDHFTESTGGKYYETLSKWLHLLIVGFCRTEKAVNAKVRQIETEYQKRLKAFRARGGKTQWETLYAFLDLEFTWNQDFRLRYHKVVSRTRELLES